MIKIDDIWNLDNSEAKKLLYELLTIENRKFNFRFDWSCWTEIENYLIKLYLSSYENSFSIRDNLAALICEVEMFFVSGINTGLVNKHNINMILSNLTNSQNGFKVLEYLPRRLWGLFGCSTKDKILINPEMKRHLNSPSLTSNDIRRLYMFHEISHKVLNILKDEDTINKYLKTLDKVLEDEGIYSKDTSGKEFIRDGFWLIEESLAQELAEYLTYYSTFKERPHYQYRLDISGPVLTNHDYYGIFQVPTINFGKTLRGCGVKTGTNDEILLDMIKKALNGSFPLYVINEYKQGNGHLYYDLFIILRAMGKIKVRKYASFGVGQDIYDDTNASLRLINSLCYKNADFREYPIGGFLSLDFESYLPRFVGYPGYYII